MSSDLACKPHVWAGISLSPGHALLPFTRGKVLGGHEDLRLQMAAGKVARHSESKIAWASRVLGALHRPLQICRLPRSAMQLGRTDYALDPIA